MGKAEAAVLGIAGGVLMGLAFGYALWGLPVDELNAKLDQSRADLVKTEGWLRDEIRSSDERQEQLSRQLERTLADLARARAQLGAASSPSAAPGGATVAGPGEAARTSR
jgi:hypothetical protein